jgi:hypothetical protein
MIVLIAVTIATGLLTACALSSLGWMAAVLGAPVAASVAAILAGAVLAWQSTRREQQARALDAQTKLMVAALRDVSRKVEPESPAPKVSRRRLGA